jgi:hypothetical protein
MAVEKLTVPSDRKTKSFDSPTLKTMIPSSPGIPGMIDHQSQMAYDGRV